jgi:excisionase family DNA binding protein
MFQTAQIFQIALHDKQEVELVSMLYRFLTAPGAPSLISSDGATIELTPSIRTCLIRVAKELQEGKALAVVPLMRELSTTTAADLLGVSRPFIVQECEAKRLPFHFVGTHRRVLLKDVLAYNEQRQVVHRQPIIRIVRQVGQMSDYDIFIEPDTSGVAMDKHAVIRTVDIREFLERAARFLASDIPVAVTRGGATIGLYVPVVRRRPMLKENS